MTALAREVHLAYPRRKARPSHRSGIGSGKTKVDPEDEPIRVTASQS